jgi:hypothetical protein
MEPVEAAEDAATDAPLPPHVTTFEVEGAAEALAIDVRAVHAAFDEGNTWCPLM